MRWELLFCHSFWNDIKIQTLSVATECEGSLYSEQLLAAPVCDRLPHYHFAQQERTQLNSPSEKTENSLGLLTSLSSAVRRAASWGPGSTALPKQGAVVPCAGWHRTASEGSPSYQEVQVHMMRHGNKKPYPYHDFCPQPTPSG